MSGIAGDRQGQYLDVLNRVLSGESVSILKPHK